MLSKFLRTAKFRYPPVITSRHQKLPQVISVRMFPMIPPTQYDMPWPQRFQMRYVLRNYWETIPLFLVMVFGCSLIVFFSVWSYQHKVDVVYLKHSSQNISRTMDLRNPTIHKIVTINQKYEPWPEMQDVLDKMKEAERRASLESCDTT